MRGVEHLILAFALCVLIAAQAQAFVRIDAEGEAVQIASTTEAVGDKNILGLVRDLEKITGLQLYVKNGYIRTPLVSDSAAFWNPFDVLFRIVHRGSWTARALFLSALQSESVYKIRGGSDAMLGRVYKGDLIELDFMDARYLRFRGVPPETFNSAMIFLHELVHRHLELPDPSLEQIRHDRGARGSTVEFMNHIERELKLPERLHYFPKPNPIPGSSGYCIFFGKDGSRIEIDLELFRSVLESGKNQGYVGLLRKNQ